MAYLLITDWITSVPIKKAIADVEKAIIESLDKQYADFLSPLKDSLAPKIFGLKYVQKFAKRTGELYIVPDEVSIYSQSQVVWEELYVCYSHH